MTEEINKWNSDKVDAFYGKKILECFLDKEENELRFVFEDGTKAKLWDSGQECCETRYITTDDDPKDLIGGILQGVVAKIGPMTTNRHGEDHEICFVEVLTDKASITLTTHNENNGFYGGFNIRMQFVDGK